MCGQVGIICDGLSRPTAPGPPGPGDGGPHGLGRWRDLLGPDPGPGHASPHLRAPGIHVCLAAVVGSGLVLPPAHWAGRLHRWGLPTFGPRLAGRGATHPPGAHREDGRRRRQGRPASRNPRRWHLPLQGSIVRRSPNESRGLNKSLEGAVRVLVGRPAPGPDARQYRSPFHCPAPTVRTTSDLPRATM
jgi:hypothetical protein